MMMTLIACVNPTQLAKSSPTVAAKTPLSAAAYRQALVLRFSWVSTSAATSHVGGLHNVRHPQSINLSDKHYFLNALL